MLAVPADRLPTALADLDPGNRALLDLSLRRGVSDAEIGELLRKDPDDVARGREAVLELIADALEVGGDDRRDRVRRAIVELPDDAWRARLVEPEPPARRAEPPPPPAAVTEEKPEPAREPEPEPVGRPSKAEPTDSIRFDPPAERPRLGRWLALIGLLLAVVVAIVLLASGGDDDDSEPAPQGDNQKETTGGPDPEPRTAARRAALTALAGERGRGRVAAREDGRVVISIRGLPPARGEYVAWLYDDVVNARSLGAIPASGRLTTRLPARAARYRFLDISQEPADGNPNHSGDSVLRARVSQLLGD